MVSHEDIEMTPRAYAFAVVGMLLLALILTACVDMPVSPPEPEHVRELNRAVQLLVKPEGKQP